jgi:hypothetical protein
MMVAFTYAWFVDVLPAEVPVSWGADGRWPTPRAPGAWLLALAVAATVTQGAGRFGFFSHRMALMLCAAVSGLVSGVWWALLSVALSASLSMPGPRAVLSCVVVWVLLLTFATGLVWGRAQGVSTTLLPDPRLPRFDLPADGPARWQVRFYTGFFTVGGCLLAVFGSTVFWSSAVVAVIAWAGAALSILLGQMTLRIDDRGITPRAVGPADAGQHPVRPGRGGHAGIVHPLSWGGHANRVINARSGMWPRTGPGITLVLVDGRKLGLALEAADVAAGLVNSHLDRARGGPYTGPLRRLQDGQAEV